MRFVAMMLIALPAVACGAEPAHNRNGAGTVQTPQYDKPDLPLALARMPMNQQENCVGIAVVAAALVEGRQHPDLEAQPADLVALHIYDRLGTDQSIDFPSQVVIASQITPIFDAATLDELSELVAGFYKRDYEKLIRSKKGIARLEQATSMRVQTSVELDRLLTLDPDRLSCFCGDGMRIFTDGKTEETSHAFLIQKTKYDQFVVYDPNAPGEPHECELEQMTTGLTIAWTCRYRDTGETTTQRYHIVPQTRYFGVLFSDPRL
ncbi:MAG: hypothetical protein ACR2NU_13775 [Aeoliella sp.]